MITKKGIAPVATETASITVKDTVKESPKEIKLKKKVLPKKPKAEKVGETKTATLIKTKEAKKEALVKHVTKENKNNLIEGVIANREVKYIYPEDVVDTLSRKSYRQKIRNTLNRLEKAMLKVEDRNSKEYSKAKKAYDAYSKEHLKVA